MSKTEVTESISIEEIEQIAYNFARKYMEWDEPIPNFSERFEGKLESCIANPFQQISGIDLYPELFDKAAILFYLMIKNHPFRNGNKRIGLLVLILFLYKNGYWLQTSNDLIYNFARSIAESEAGRKDEKLKEIKAFLEENSIERAI